MICSYENDIVIGQGSCYYPFYTMVNSFHCFYNCLEITGMTNHICIGKIQADKIGRFMIDFRNDCIGNSIRTHFRLQVVSGHFGRGNHDSFFSFKFVFTSAAEKECYVRIFFCFSNSDLREHIFCNHFTKGHFQIIIFKHYVNIFEMMIVFSHRCIIQ